MAMLYAEGVKKRLLIVERTKVGVERNAERAVGLGRWGMMGAGAGCSEANLNGGQPCFLVNRRSCLLDLHRLRNSSLRYKLGLGINRVLSYLGGICRNTKSC
jgi:hypothetical protein